MFEFKGSTQEKPPSEIFRFGYGKAANDKKVPDPVGSETFGEVSPSNKQFLSARRSSSRLFSAMLSLGSPQFEIQQNPVEFKPVAKKKEPVEGLILSSSCPGELSPK
jgi:hypothetical protein